MSEGNYEDHLLREMTTDAGENDNDCDPKPESFGDWLESHGDSLPLPESFTQWLNSTGDSICE